MRAWDTVQLARHEDRPYALDYVARIFDDFAALLLAARRASAAAR
jgi:acetyl-CoA carboxylase alpha subunit